MRSASISARVRRYKSSFLLTWCIGAGVLAILCSGAINGLDEAYAVYPAWRITEGELPYRHFFVLTTPLLYECLGGAMRLLGPHLWVGRVFAVVTLLVCAIALRHLLRRLISTDASRWIALLPAIVVAAIFGIPWYTHFASLFAIASLACALRPGSATASVASGVLAVTALATKQDIGAVALVGSTFLRVLAGRRRDPARSAHLLFVLGVLGAVCSFALFFAVRGYLPEMLHTLFFDAVHAKRVAFAKFVARMSAVSAYWAVFAWVNHKPLLGKRRTVWDAIAFTVFVVLIVLTVKQPWPGRLPYGTAWGAIVGLIGFTHSRVLVEGVAERRWTAMRGAALVSLLWVLGGCVAGTDLLHVAGVAWLPAIPVYEIGRRSLADRRLVCSGVGLALAAVLVCNVTSVHLRYAGTPPRWSERCLLSGVGATSEACSDIRQLKHLMSAFEREHGRSPRLIAQPSPLPNFLLRVPSPLYRFTFYFETEPQAIPGADFWLVSKRLGAPAPTAPSPEYVLAAELKTQAVFSSKPPR